MEKHDDYINFLSKLEEKFLITDNGIFEINNTNISTNNILNKWCDDNNNLKKNNLKSYNDKKTAANIVSTITEIKAREYISSIDKNLIFSSGDFGLSLNIKVGDLIIFETSSILDDFESGSIEENKKLIQHYINVMENNYVNLLMYLHELLGKKSVDNRNLEKLTFNIPLNLNKAEDSNKLRDLRNMSSKIMPSQRRSRVQNGGGNETNN